MAARTTNEIIANMSNIGDSGQNSFVEDWGAFAKELLYESGVSRKYINSPAAAYYLAKIVTDMVDTGALSSLSNQFIATLRVNHPHSEDEEEGGGNV